MPRLNQADLLARVLHKDADMIVLDKPPGIAVHKGPGGGETLDQYFESLRFGAGQNPELAHRLDKDTSGCLVLGRSRVALARLGKLFSEGRAAKTYWAVVVGSVIADAGVIDAPLAQRSHERRSWWMKVDPAGDASLTRWRVLGRADGLIWLELKPETGRTHQLRVHMAHLGTPIAGDAIYGGDQALAAARHMHLHAREISLPLDAIRPVHVVAAPPEHMHTLLSACGWHA
jgi:tRNA pseudouridine32 synthase / 23S rRNA pseudouridine746 synthase